MNWCILIPLLVGLISAILGYLLGRLFGNNNKESEAYIARISQLESDLEACKKSRNTLENDLQSAKDSITKLSADDDVHISSFSAPVKDVPAVFFSADAAKAAFGKKVKQDDLKIVEGIGPKIEQLFHGFEIKTWKALSETSVEKCKEVLKSGGDRFKMHNPGTWPKQAQLAYEGKWKELVEWQDKLDGGKA